MQGPERDSAGMDSMDESKDIIERRGPERRGPCIRGLARATPLQRDQDYGRSDDSDRRDRISSA